MIDFSRIHDLINSNKTFLITTHINPDGDAIGSELALYRFLKTFDKQVDIINQDPTPDNMKFMDQGNVIKVLAELEGEPKFETYDVIFILDLNQLSRTGELEKYIRSSEIKIVCIDHHQNPENFTGYKYVDSSYGSTGEILFDLFETMKGFKLTYDIALPLYVAIITDTGSFKYERTKPETHLKAAKLLSLGLDPKSIYASVYDQGNLNKVKLLARGLNSIELFHDDRVAVMKIMRQDLIETGTSETDTESFVNYTLTFKNVVIGFFIFEMENGVKISFRSVGDRPVNKLAAEFGGGGHINAAATRIPGGKVEEVAPKVIEASKNYL